MSEVIQVAAPQEPSVVLLDLDARHALAVRIESNQATIAAMMEKAEHKSTAPALKTTLIATASLFADTQTRLTALLESGAPSFAFAADMARLAECEASAFEQLRRKSYNDLLDLARNNASER